MKTYHGSCFCWAVLFRADGDLALGTMRCNCTFCRKMRYWEMRLPDPAGFRVLKGDALLSITPPGRQGDDPAVMQHYFCSRCGMRLWTYGDLPELGGEFRAIFVPALNASEEELIAAPVTIVDGAHDNWWEPAPETRHL